MNTQKITITLIILALFLSQATTLFAQSVGINEDGSEPDSRAILDVKSTSKGVLLPRLSDTERDALFRDVPFGMMIFNTTDSALQIFMDTAWYSLSMGTVETAPEKYFNDVTSATGETWMDRNLGASQVATASDDPDSYGDLYQWGRAADGHESRTSDIYDGDANGKPSTYDENGAWDGKFITAVTSPVDWLDPQNDNLWQGASGINNPCPSGYRLPTEAEWEAERQSWSSNDAAGAFASPLKLPVVGYRNYGLGSLHDVGSRGRYWSSTVDGSYSRRLNFYSSHARMSSRYRAYGFSVRCIKD